MVLMQYGKKTFRFVFITRSMKIKIELFKDLCNCKMQISSIIADFGEEFQILLDHVNDFAVALCYVISGFILC